MMNFNEIKDAIESLPRDEFISLMHWMLKKDMKQWSSQIENDLNSEKLDFLLQEAHDEYERLIK